MRKFREHLRERLAGVLARSDGDQIRARMREEQAHQVFAGVTGSANNSDGNFFGFAHECRGSAKSKSPAGVKPAGRGTNFGLTLAILETFASAGLSVFFALFHTRIARQITMRLERRAKGRVRFQQRARNAVPNRASLAGGTATLHIHANV